MSAPDPSKAEGDALGPFARYLSLWVALAIAGGILLGSLVPDIFRMLAGLEIARVNLVVAALIWAMIFPMMLNVDLGAVRGVGAKPKGLLISVVVSWFVKPFSMAALGWLFFEILFRDFVTPEDATSYIAGMILLGAAPCTAMVFVWSHLAKGDATYTLVQVSLNDIIMVFAYVPIVGLLLGLSDIAVPWETLLLSVMLYIVAPLAAGAWLRGRMLKRGGPRALARLTDSLKPAGMAALLLTVALLFGFQGKTILEKPFVIALIAVPLLIQSYGNFLITLWWARAWRVPYAVTAPAALIATSNFFELAVAVAISLFGIDSGAALATVVGVLVEVPVMLSLVALAGRMRRILPD